MKNFPKLLFAMFCFAPFFASAQNVENPMVREEVPAIVVTSEQLLIESNDLACPNDEILVIVEDVLGNDSYSKLLFKYCEGEPLSAIDPYEKIPSGVYTIIGSSRQEFFAQRLIVD